MAAPRRLRVLRIDDDLDAGGNPETPSYAAQRAPRHLESVELYKGNRVVAGIRSWEDAIAFWTSYDRESPIDLIISDVRFDDKTSPLANLATESSRLHLPTGISHFKVFAALSRAQDRPLGVGLHTKEARVWRDNANSRDRDLHYVAMLAAHEIGELAAILGEADELHGRDAEACWTWLEKRTVLSDDFRRAIPSALCQFRRSLGPMRLMPKDYDALVKFCGRMEASADSGERTMLYLNDQEDIGFPIVKSNGQRDVVSFRSLFADVLLTRIDYRFEYEGLPKSCFMIRQDEEFHRLDNGNPRIGALIYQCGEWGRAYEQALEILAQVGSWPGGVAGTTLSCAKETIGAGYLAAAIAILLKDTERERDIFAAWRAVYTSYAWNPFSDAFTQERASSEGLTIQFWLKTIAKIAQHNGSVDRYKVKDLFEEYGFFPEEEVIPYDNRTFESQDNESDVYDQDDLILDELAALDPNGADANIRRGLPGTMRCINLLLQMGILLRHGSGVYVPGPKRFSENLTPPYPTHMPRGFMALSKLGPAFGSHADHLDKPQRTLRKLFGYGDGEDSNIFQRNIAKAFGLEKPEEGLAFLHAFREGRSPITWVKALCREYAREELVWTDEGSWPASLRDGP